MLFAVSHAPLTPACKPPCFFSDLSHCPFFNFFQSQPSANPSGCHRHLRTHGRPALQLWLSCLSILVFGRSTCAGAQDLPSRNAFLVPAPESVIVGWNHESHSAILRHCILCSSGPVLLSMDSVCNHTLMLAHCFQDTCQAKHGTSLASCCGKWHSVYRCGDLQGMPQSAGIGC